MIFHPAEEEISLHITRRPCYALPYVYGAKLDSLSPPDVASIQTVVHATATAAIDPSV